MNTIASESDACRVPPELLYEILDTLPAKELVVLRGISHTFFDTVNALLRSRLHHIVDDPTQELVFESSRPAEYQKGHCQTTEFQGFLPQSKENYGTELARFALPSRPADTCILPLEEDEAFGNVILSVQIRTVEPEPEPEKEEHPSAIPFAAHHLLTPPATPSSTPPTFSPLQLALQSAVGINPRSLPMTPASTPPRGPPSISISSSHSVAEAPERLYRSWFEDSSLISAPRQGKTSPQVVHPSGCALRSATINCLQVEPTSPVGYPGYSYGSGAYIPTRPTLFEFAYEDIQLDVGRLISQVEEQRYREASTRPVMLWMMA
ncbi:hypothetical protein P7C70_g2870, partial [Phenoliferia sp. Uapishka_3]